MLSMPLTYWNYTFATVVYLINRMPTPTLQLSSQNKNLFGSSPNYSKLHVFSCLCYHWLCPYPKHKLAPHSVPCFFLGNSLTQSAYLCFDPSTNKLNVSRHVKFVESIFPLSSFSSHALCPESTTVSKWIPLILFLPTTSSSASPPAISSTSTPTTLLPNVDLPQPVDHTNLTSQPDPSSKTISENLCSSIDETFSISQLEPQPDPISETPNPPIDWTFLTGLLTTLEPRVIITRSKHYIHKPVQKLYFSDQLQPSTSLEPTTVIQAIKDPKWH